ncbi:hypothetical protein I6J72_08900 [Corynebacterium sp. FDAARGOS 1242]|uniref:hypothetical protein n=1 Tax=Corynebacterium sp. FDAARGOS 1242 TaxID=2778078 RepID=UPI00194DFCFE|nr:hypothetical protein [Corynebacterium sp. FDAARGOS 1242]QRP97292.1 hypothetical protein I6J72_08900 [Corynebacterium sp. FDAARGOS 1242]
MSASIPDSVKTRKRYITLADLSSCLIILSLPLQFWDSFTSLMVACLGTLLTGLLTARLRGAIGAADLPRTELDEYEMQQHLEARDDGLKFSLAALVILLPVTGLIAWGARTMPMMDGVFVSQLYLKIILLLMVWVPFSVARSLAGKMNRDELISKE